MNSESQTPLGWKFRLDKTGRLMYLSGPGGKTTQFDYEVFPDNEEQVKSVSRRGNGSQVIYEFDRQGRRMHMRDRAGTVDYTWTKTGQFRSAQRQDGPMLGYDYDALGRLVKLRIDGVAEIGYSYDFMGRLEVMETPAGPVKYEYWTGQGKVKRTLPNKVCTFWEYNTEGQLTAIEHVDPSNHLIAKFSYEYRPDGLIAAITEWWPQGEYRLSFEYDKVQRLVSLDDGKGGNWRAEYDPMGNRVRGGFQGEETGECRYDWAGRLISLGGEPCEHDASGNLTRIKLNGRAQQFEYDHDNRLQQVNQGEVIYEYDGDGNLIVRTVRGARTTFITDPFTDIWRPLLETNGDGRQRFFIWEDRIPLAMIEDGKPLFFLHDHLGSIRCIVDMSGVVVEQRDYSVFGVCSSNLNSTDLMPGFVGFFRDEDSGMYMTRARAYSAELGRFLQTDPQHRLPSENQAALSQYVYCGDDPVNLVDNNGAEPHSAFDTWLDAHIEWRSKWRQMSLGERLSDFGSAFGKGRFFGTRFGEEAVQQYAEKWARTGNWLWAIPTGVASLWTGKTWGDTVTVLSGAQAVQGVIRTSVGLNMLIESRSPSEVFKKLGRVIYDARKHSTIRSEISRFMAKDMEGVRKMGDLDHLFLPNAPKWWAQQQPWLRRLEGFKGGGWNYLEMPKWLNRWMGTSSKNVLTWLPRETVHTAIRLGVGMSAIAAGQRGLELGTHVREGFEKIGSLSKLSGSSVQSLSPSTIGGVYLGGAGRCLDGLGQITGVAIDDKTGNLVLLTEKSGKVDLPPMRLDDVVVIFRSVYLHGEGLSVSIDPLPDNPHGPVMNVRHGKGTADTYVGWVLFETDRIMKCYNQGEDNLSNREVSSAVSGYKEVLDTIYFGGDFADGRKPGGNWERFWIVPAEVTRYRANTGKLTLFDVPLKVNTQKMVLRKGKLEDDPNGQSSRGARAFIEWFTCHYEGIAQEQYIQPPSETGINGPVPIYAELRRIALTTAIAEQLRDQGVPMPFWMRDYQVKKVMVTATTRSLTTTRKKEDGRFSEIYGGVSLSPADSVIKDVKSKEDVAKLPTLQQETAIKSITAANMLSPAVANAAANQPLLTAFAVSTPDRDVTALSMPGAESTALAPNRLSETDLEVTGEGGVRLSLVRNFNSFFQPKGELGTGWTLDLPYLGRAVVPTERTDYSSKSMTIPELIMPLNTLYARFSRDENVPQFGARLLVPDKSCEILALAGANNPLVPMARRMIIFRDGLCWLFDEEGRFVAEEYKPVTKVYQRDEAGRVLRILGYFGDKQNAAIQFEYDSQNRISAAFPLQVRQIVHPQEESKKKGFFERVFGGHHGTEDRLEHEYEKHPESGVSFTYDKAGMLISVDTPDTTVIYKYENGLVTDVSHVPKGANADDAKSTVRKFEYAANGQLVAEIASDGGRISYNVQQQEGKRRISIGSNGTKVIAEYDSANRPLEMTEADGTQTTWKYKEDGAVTAETVLPTGESSRMELSGDRKKRTMSASDSPVISEGLDDAGRVVKLSVEKTPAIGEDTSVGPSDGDKPMEEVFTQQWQQDGLPGSVDFKTHTIKPEYDEHGRLKRVLRVKPTGTDSFDEWQETRFDDSGRVTEIKDCRSGNVAMNYDAEGNIAGVETERDGQRVGYAFTRDAHGRITGVNSPSAQETCEYDTSGDPLSVHVKSGQAEARVEFSEGRPSRVTQFDGGQVEFDYLDDGPAKGLLKEVRTPAIDLQYNYDEHGTLAEVACGDAYRVIYGYDENGNLASLDYVPAAGS